jgi:hypothetical protein
VEQDDQKEKREERGGKRGKGKGGNTFGRRRGVGENVSFKEGLNQFAEMGACWGYTIGA